MDKMKVACEHGVPVGTLRQEVSSDLSGKWTVFIPLVP